MTKRIEDDMAERRESHINLIDKITRIEVGIAKGFAESVAHHESTSRYISEMKTDVERITHSLYGNGKEGIITKIAKMNQRLNLLWLILVTSVGAYVTVATGVIQAVLVNILTK